ncbi:SMP-30/gluconolactonase/LRE family protein [Streptomyces sp. NPDC048496]|uniref:SMP-30/gluconolactonase/LRE family protein n=1 Tax=Streptomyces sp. NPDC048496 TaxID=3365558 RepID=UPI00371E05CD
MAGLEAVVQSVATLGEGPAWDSDAQRLIWVDILGSRIHTYAPSSGRCTVTATEQHVGAALPRAGGGLVVNLRDGVACYGPDDAFAWLHHEPVPGRRGNHAAVGPDGSLWAGSMAYDESPGGGNLLRITPDGTVTEILGDVTISNGIGWSPDGRLMYYVDTPTRRIDVFDVMGDHDIARRREFVTIESGAGFPDGLTVDADGRVWVALWDGSAIRRYSPSGDLDRILRVPTKRPTACAFGGADLRDLYITTARVGLEAPHLYAGSLLVLPDAGRGLDQPAFAG